MGNKEQVQSKCPLCGTTRLIGQIKWGGFKITNYFIQYRSAPGGKKPGTGRGYRGSAKGYGFHLIREKSKRLDEITEDDPYYEEVKNMAESVIKTAKMLKKLGIIKEGEI